MISTQ
jgi:hypothetical protein